MARLFVAVWPPVPVVEQLRAWLRPSGSGLLWTTEHQWHITLRFLGEADVDAAATAVGGITHEPVVARMGPGLRVLGRSAVVTPVTGLDPLAAEVGRAMGGIGRPPEGRGFQGHLTLGRIATTDRFTLPPAAPTAEWPVTDLALVRSTLLASGARYDTVRVIALLPRTP